MNAIVVEVTFQRRFLRIAWLAAVVVAAVGGWFWGRALLVSHQGAPPVPARSQARQTSFASGSAEGRWLKAVKEAKKEDFPRLLEEWKTLFPEGENYLEGRPENALCWIFAMWLVKDSEGFLNAVTAPDYEYSHWAVQVLVQLKPEQAADLLFGPAHGNLERHFLFDGAKELAARHPALYLKLNPSGTVDLTPGIGSYDSDWYTAIANLAKTDAVAAAKACLGWKVENDPASISQALESVAAAWKTTDPSIREWINGITDPKLRNFANHARLCVLAEKDPRAALAELYSTKLEDAERIDAPREILTQLGKADPIAALKLMKDVEEIFPEPIDPFAEPPPKEESERGANPFNELGSDGVRDAVLDAVVGNLPNDPSQFFGALHQLSAEMGGGDSAWQRGVEAALVRLKSESWSADECLTVANLWAVGLNGERDEATMQQLAKRAAHVNPELAFASLVQLPAAAQPAFAAELIKQDHASDAAQIIALLSHLTAAQWNDDLGKALGNHPEDYASVIASLPAEITLKARESFLEKWGARDPEAAAQWLASLPEDTASSPAAKALARAWVIYDEYGVSEWAATLPSGPNRDAVAATLAYSIAKTQPDEAWQWVSSIADPMARIKALTDLDYRWQYDAPLEFRAALDEARRADGMTDRGEKPPPDPDDPFAEDPFK